ncbi:Lnb N-terminal periplasmic domain-containing protein [Salinisphaera sp. RV14]|uniref:Lnb N-terminal periplasmic domain-containing protein n=1 Tax=Salinisphaera sp. RV14 TaxID=3454140 RepID=UPI003F82617A
MTAALLIAARVVAGLLVLLVAGYGTGALWFRGPNPRALRIALIAAWWAAALGGLAGLIAADRLGPAIFALAGLAFALWWAQIRPRSDRPWADDVARVLHVERHGPQVRLHNVRNFDWRTRDDYTPRWEIRDYDLDQLIAVDLVASYWMGPTIAHTLVSFAFADGRHLVFSVEVRRLAGEDFSAIGGLFRQCELALVAADERDIVRTRTTARREDVYLYRVAMPRHAIRALFEAYLDTADTLEYRPRFYHTLTSNCTTLVYDMVKAIVPGLPWNWRLLASGHLPEYLYDLGALDTRLPLAELRRRGCINAAAIASDSDGHASPDFSDAIRRGLPAPEGAPTPPP